MNRLQLAIAGAAFTFATTGALAQVTTAGLVGKVVDQSGAPISNAHVVITYLPSNTRASARTNARGMYQNHSLRDGGPYKVEVYVGGSGSLLQDRLVASQEVDELHQSADTECNLKAQ